jgi:hypothetical protein
VNQTTDDRVVDEGSELPSPGCRCKGNQYGEPRQSQRCHPETEWVFEVRSGEVHGRELWDPPVTRLRKDLLNEQEPERSEERPLKERRKGPVMPQLHLRALQPIDIVVDALQFLPIGRAVKAAIPDIRHFAQYGVIRRLQNG